MRKFNLLGLSTIAIIAAALTGCSNSDSPKDENVTSGAKMALSATTSSGTYCVTGNIIISGGALTTPVSIPTDCTDTAGHEVILQPGTYSVTVEDADANPATPMCTSSSVGLVGCVLNPSPTTFTVGLGTTVDVPLAFTFSYENAVDQNVLFGVGSAQVTLGPVTDQERCGTGATAPVCSATQICASLDGGAYACYVACTTADTSVINAGTCTASGAMCVPVGVQNVAQRATNPAAMPVPLVIGEEGSLDATLHVCAALAPSGGAGGAGGATGVGGASSTGGSSAAGGTSAVAGATSVGGTTATAGSTST